MVATPKETELWTPPGVTHQMVTSVGRNAETGDTIFEYRFQVHDEVTNRKHEFRVLADTDTSKAHIEEMVGNAFESWLIDVRMRHSKPAPTPEQRKEIGKILNQIKAHKIKRKGSSNNKIYYNGLKQGGTMQQDIEIQITDEDIRNALQQKISQVTNLELKVSALSRIIV